MARYYTGNKDETVAPPLPFNVGRENDDSAAKDTQIVLNRHVEGGAAGDTVTVSKDRATWLIAQGYATRPEDYVDQYANSRRPATPPEEPPEEPEEPEVEPEEPDPKPDPEPDPKPDPEPDPKPDPKPDPEPDEGEGAA